MEIDKIKKLEKNKGFKRSFFTNQVWRKYALVPPALVLFVSLFGVVYMYNTDRLLSYYCLPFILLLLISTIWFKSTRKYLINQEVESSPNFSLCLVLPLYKEGNKQFYLFNTGANRLNRYLLEKVKSDVLAKRKENTIDFQSIRKGEFEKIDDDFCITVDLNFKKGILPLPSKGDTDRYLAYYGNDKIKGISPKDIVSFL